MSKVIVIYDSECGFCRWSIDLFRQWDKRGILRFIPCKSEDRAREFPHIPQEECMGALQAILSNGLRKSGFDAVAHVMKYFSGWKKVAGFLFTYTPGLPIIGRAVYTWVAKNRYKIKRDDDTCYL